MIGGGDVVVDHVEGEVVSAGEGPDGDGEEGRGAEGAGVPENRGGGERTQQAVAGEIAHGGTRRGVNCRGWPDG